MSRKPKLIYPGSLRLLPGGEEIILGKHGKPMARLTSFVASGEPRRLGGREGEIRIAPDFDEEDERIQAMFR